MATDVKFHRWLQQRLIDLGYKVNITGRNDAATQAAIRDIQKNSGLKETGTATMGFMERLRSLRMAAPPKMPSGDTVPMPRLRPRPQPLASDEEMPMPRLRPRMEAHREPIGARPSFPMPNMRPSREQMGPMAAHGMARPPMQLEASGAIPSSPPPHANVNMVPASEPLSQGGNRELLSRALNMPLPSAEASPAAGTPPALGAPGSGAGLPLGAPPGVPLTGPGGSPAPQYQQNLWTELFRKLPGYQQQPMVEPTTGNSPLAGVEQYQTDAPPMQPPMPPPQQPQPQGMPLAAFQGRFDPEAMATAGMGMPGMSQAEMAKRILLQKLLQLPGR